MSFTLRFPRGQFSSQVTFTVLGETVTITDDRPRRRVTKERARNEYRNLINAGYVPVA